LTVRRGAPGSGGQAGQEKRLRRVVI
jgi:hypothetical protein